MPCAYNKTKNVVPKVPWQGSFGTTFFVYCQHKASYITKMEKVTLGGGGLRIFGEGF